MWRRSLFEVKNLKVVCINNFEYIDPNCLSKYVYKNIWANGYIYNLPKRKKGFQYNASG